MEYDYGIDGSEQGPKSDDPSSIFSVTFCCEIHELQHIPILAVQSLLHTGHIIHYLADYQAKGQGHPTKK